MTGNEAGVLCVLSYLAYGYLHRRLSESHPKVLRTFLKISKDVRRFRRKPSEDYRPPFIDVLVGAKVAANLKQREDNDVHSLSTVKI